MFYIHLYFCLRLLALIPTVGGFDCCFYQADDIDGSAQSVRKKLSFDSDEEDNASSSKSWYQYSSSESDWLQGGAIDLEEMSDPEPLQPDESIGPLSDSFIQSATDDLPEESALKGFFKLNKVYEITN